MKPIGTPTVLTLATGQAVNALVVKTYDVPATAPDSQPAVDLLYIDPATSKAVTASNVPHMSNVPPGPFYRDADQSPNQ